ncbi:MAG TPA: CoA ester lyase [Alphaproteobacteria bacterium]|nr:CoA ester lyase [Alphaproteobacteria bacterium]
MTSPIAASAPRPRRSLIFAPGLKPEMFAKALGAGADIVCVDIEDAVAPAYKAEARAKTLTLFAERPETGTVEAIVRINPMSTADGLRDVLAVVEAKDPPPSLMMTKVRTADEVRQLDGLLGDAQPHIRLQVIIETNEGLENAYAIAQSSSRVDALLFGGYDMAAELRVEPLWDPLLYARARVAHAAAGAGLDLLDAPNLDLEDMDGLGVGARNARAIGFTGKAAIHPKQIPVINETFSPSADDVAAARRIVEAFETEGGTGLLVVDGKLVEAPVLRAMQRTLKIAERVAVADRAGALQAERNR